jgi:EAL domain-containing protein (putative c-di-GMP-specific phosphodiesterase class I)
VTRRRASVHLQLLVASPPVVVSAIQLGKALGVEILAEGIEEPTQLLNLLQEHGDSGQGFWPGPSRPPLEQLIERQTHLTVTP